MTLAINDFISTRGISGSSRGAELIRQALAGSGSEEVATVAPDSKPMTRIGRLAQMLTWDFITAPRRAARSGCNIIIHATNTGRGSRRVKSVVVMHDTMVLDHPGLFNKWFVLYARMTFGVSARAADMIVTPSVHSAARVVARWPRTATRVRVIPWPAPTPVISDLSSETVEVKGGSVLVVASLDKHKRLGLAVEVVSKLRELCSLDLRLDMVVRTGNDEGSVLETVGRLDPDGDWVFLHRQVSEAALAHLYATATVTLVPSLDEGYCLPAVESIARGTPVVHAGRGALPEVIPMYPHALAGQNDFGVLYERLLAALDGPVGSRQLEDFRAQAEHFASGTFRSRWHNVINELAE